MVVKTGHLRALASGIRSCYVTPAANSLPQLPSSLSQFSIRCNSSSSTSGRGEGQHHGSTRQIFTMPSTEANKKEAEKSASEEEVQISPSMNEVNLKEAIFQPEVIIFDKDGTLVCFHTMWNSWCEELAIRMKSESDRDIEDNVYELMGYDKEKKKVRLGLLAEKTHPYIREKLEEMLVKQEGFSSWEARKLVDSTWEDAPRDMQIKITGNLQDLFSRLKRKNIKIAVCTSDSREGTLEFLDKMNLTDMVDIVVCGDDKESISKPDPHNARYICEQLGIDLSDAIMVGDTPADTIMGQSANLGLTIGVLTGVGTEDDLTHADLIVDDVTQVVDLVTPPENDTGKEWHSVQVTARGLYKIAERSCLFHRKLTNNFSED